jgi:serine/threonine protein kinase
VNGWKCCIKELSGKEIKYDRINAEKEIQVLASLPPHPHLIEFLGYRFTLNSISIFTAMYEGDLYKLMSHYRDQESFEMKESLIIEYASQILSALVTLHSMNIIHRDIKSSNIFYDLIERGNPNEFPKVNLRLGDFGESKALENSWHRNKTKTCVGTTLWMAPEVLQSMGKKSYNLSADIWSFGMVLYELMVFNVPYHEQKGFAAHKRIVEGTLPQLDETLRKKYERIVDIWKSTLRMDPNERPDAKTIHQMFDKLSKTDWNR